MDIFAAGDNLIGVWVCVVCVLWGFARVHLTSITYIKFLSNLPPINPTVALTPPKRIRIDFRTIGI